MMVYPVPIMKHEYMTKNLTATSGPANQLRIRTFLIQSVSLSLPVVFHHWPLGQPAFLKNPSPSS
jgi:hypothetical protein